MRASADPGSVPAVSVGEPEADQDQEPWTLLGAALVALLPAFSRPQGSDSTFGDFLDDLRAALPANDGGEGPGALDPPPAASR